MDVLICTAKGQDEWRDALAVCLPEARVHVWPDAPTCDYAVVWKPPSAMFASQLRLKAMFSLGAGVDGLLAMPALPRDVPLVRMEDCGMAAQMIEYALYVALRRFRRFDEYAVAQAEGRWAPRGYRMRGDFSIGVLGLGVLGAAVAQALADFGFAVSGWSRTAKSIDGIECLHGSSGLDALLARSELLLVLLPLTGDTESLLDGERLAHLPEGAALTNLSRGELLVDDDVLAALDSGQLAEAYLDVFEREPLPRDHRYWNHPRVRMTPHVAALTPHVIACEQVAEKIRHLESGEAVSGIVDRKRGY